MKLDLNKRAFDWYKHEMYLEKGDFVRFFVRYGGCSTVQSGFSLGVAKDEPFEIGLEMTIENITFYIEEKDLWYLDGHSLLVEFDETHDEPAFEYKNRA